MYMRILTYNFLRFISPIQIAFLQGEIKNDRREVYMGSIQHYLWLGMGGFIGTIGRYLVSETMNRTMGSQFPLGTLSVNLVGSFFIGILAVVLAQPLLSHPNFRLFFIVGMMGGFTTYSSFSYDTFRLLKDGDVVRAFFYVFITFSIGLLLTFLGFLAGNSIVKKFMA